jgi:hypothetical protein
VVGAGPFCFLLCCIFLSVCFLRARNNAVSGHCGKLSTTNLLGLFAII